jgi:hypothetical protein
MDRTLFEGFEETFKDFPLVHIFFHKFDCEKSGSVVKVWQDLLTDFQIDKKRSTFEVLWNKIRKFSSSVKTSKSVNSG